MKGKAQGIKLDKSYHCGDAQTNRQCFVAENEPLGRTCSAQLVTTWGWRAAVELLLLWCKMDAEQQKLMAGLDLVHA